MNYNNHMSRLIFRLFVIVTGLACLTGCKGGEKSVEMGPVETVEAFYRSLTSGQWDDAESLCNSSDMQEYIQIYRDELSRLEKSAESAAKIASSFLEDAKITVSDTHKADDKRIVTYTLEADGLSKTKKATLTKEEGAWRVERITEAN